MGRLLKLQNGTDVRGIACEGIEGQQVNFTPEDAARIAEAFVLWLSRKTGRNCSVLKVCVGHDSRITAESLKAGILHGIGAAGARAYDAHLASTPSMFMALVYDEFDFDGSIMVTASHLPFNRNGMKFFDKDGGLEHDDITDILTLAEGLQAEGGRAGASGSGETRGTVAAGYGSGAEVYPETDILSCYSAHLVDKIRGAVHSEADYEHPLKGLRIAVDAGNGAGGFFVEKVLKPLGADTAGSRFLEPDGMFPNHIPNPEDRTAMEAIRAAVLESRADLGIIFDTDVDRMSAVLPDGTEVNRDAIIALMAAILAEEYPGGVIVTDSVTSDRLKDFLENSLHMKQHRFKRGYKNVINECRRLNESGILSPLAIETSGHGAMKENYYLDDGAYMAVKLLVYAAKAGAKGEAVGDCIRELRPAFEEKEFRIRILEEDFAAYGKLVLEGFKARALAGGLDVDPHSFEGVRISFHDEEIRGWLLLRMSLHDPLLPLNLEGEREGDIARMTVIVREMLADFRGLDPEALPRG
jgi:phosphomannomutase